MIDSPTAQPSSAAPNLELTARNCPICDSDEAIEFAKANVDLDRLGAFAFASRKVPEYMHFRLVECRQCDLLYATPAPGGETLVNAYVEASFDASNESRFAAVTYAGYLKKFLARLSDRDGALDIGTGDGAFLEQLLDAGFVNVAGVEPSAAPVRAAKPRVRDRIRHAPFRASDYAEQSFRLVTCFQTLEHMHDPLQLCRDVLRITKNGGAFFTVCHNRRALPARLMGTKSPIIDVEHLQLFSPASVRQLLERAGFSHIDVYPIVNRYPVSYFARLFPVPANLKSGLIRFLQSSGAGNLMLAMPVGNLAAVGYR